MKHTKNYLLLLALISILSCISNRNICDDDSNYDIRKSISHFKSKIEKNPNDQKSYSDLGMSYYKLSEFQNAETAFTKLLEINDEFKNAHLNRGFCRLFQNDQEGACQDFKSELLLGNDPNVFDGNKVSKYVKENCQN